ncbi:carbohydrate ABC transporter permease [Ammoniphilus sp. 3BR4]|uniref:carbohydrate ABC transporter permease n=1 Tax=Ammoniphilus sp. 3BR4 TaxID=3158265 RepID=UPI003467E8A0
MQRTNTIKDQQAIKNEVGYKMNKIKISQLTNYLFILPGLIFLMGFMVFPIVYNILLSFKNVTLMNLNGIQEYIGWTNYQTVLKDPLFSSSFKNSILYTGLSILGQFVIGFAFALFFNLKFPGRDTMRSIILLAWMMPVVIVGTLFQWMFAGDDTGIINYILQALGIIDEPHLWLSDTRTALATTMIANIWVGVPFNMLILLSGLQSIPLELYEAAKIDGAGRIRQFFHITLPMIRPTILILLILGIIYTFKAFDLIIIMTGGGPVNSSMVLPFYAYQLAFDGFEFSLGAAVSTIMFVILAAIAVLYLLLMRKEEQL